MKLNGAQKKENDNDTTAYYINMTRTHAVSVEGVDFSGVFVELQRKGKTELSTHRSPLGL